MKRLIAWYWKRRERETIASIRETFFMFGQDTSHLTDDEIKERIYEFNRRAALACRKLSYSAEDAATSIRRLSDAVNNAYVDFSRLVPHAEME